MAVALQEKERTETEALLEDVLVGAPQTLAPGLRLIGRQIPVSGGALDLIGVDQDGELVLFELKRGTLTRESVAQVLDYASDLAEMDGEVFARLIEGHSGQKGIEAIADFLDWYQQEFPNASPVLERPPRMVLVGVGADERARRIVEFLSVRGIDLQLLTFQAFDLDGKLIIARTSETASPQPGEGSGAPTKEGNRRILHQNAEDLGVLELLKEVKKAAEAKLPVYLWPGKTAYSFAFPETTEEGRPTQRTYVTISLNMKEKGKVFLRFPPRAADFAGGFLEQMAEELKEAKRIKSPTCDSEIVLTQRKWAELRRDVERVLGGFFEIWKAHREDQEAGEKEVPPDDSE